MPGAAEMNADPGIERFVVTDTVPAFRVDPGPRAIRSTQYPLHRRSQRRFDVSTRGGR